MMLNKLKSCNFQNNTQLPGPQLAEKIKRGYNMRNGLYHEPELFAPLSEELDEARDISMRVFSCLFDIMIVDVKKLLEDLMFESESKVLSRLEGSAQL